MARVISRVVTVMQALRWSGTPISPGTPTRTVRHRRKRAPPTARRETNIAASASPLLYGVHYTVHVYSSCRSGSSRKRTVWVGGVQIQEPHTHTHAHTSVPDSQGICTLIVDFKKTFIAGWARFELTARRVLKQEWNHRLNSTAVAGEQTPILHCKEGPLTKTSGQDQESISRRGFEGTEAVSE